MSKPPVIPTRPKTPLQIETLELAKIVFTSLIKLQNRNGLRPYVVENAKRGTYTFCFEVNKDLTTVFKFAHAALQALPKVVQK